MLPYKRRWIDYEVEATETGGRQEMETLLNEQRQLHEDLQAELEEAVE